MSRQFLLSFALILAIYGIKSTAGCNITCPVTHPQTIRCNSDFVIRAMPISSTVINNDTTVYTIRYYEGMKVTRGVKHALKLRKLYTALNASTCGVELQLYTHYILSGKLVNGLPYLDYCGFNQQFMRTNGYIYEGFRHGYDHGSCSCIIDTCASGNCTKSATNCIYDPQYTNGPACYSKYGICALTGRRSARTCNWISSRYRSTLTRCLSTTSTVPLL